MNLFNSKSKTIYLFFLYLFFYFYPALTNPFVPINILEASTVTLLSAILFITTYLVTYKNISNLSYNVRSTIQTIIIIILAIILFYNPFSFSALYNYYPNRIVCILLIIIWLIFVVVYSKKVNISYAIPLIIFTPSLIQAILMSNINTIWIYAKIPYLTTMLIVSGLVIYQFYRGDRR